jgi:indole-3-glycerol phosphate synthase
MSDVLQRILERKSEELARSRKQISLHDLTQIAQQQSPVRGFARAIARQVRARKPAVIAEIKKASPSKGILRENFVPADIAKSYAAGGATCLSVLTDIDFFQGHNEFLRQARGACELPVLRKDFTIDPYQVIEARSLGADCILLIVSALGDGQMQELESAAIEFGLDVLVEAHDAEEMERALRLRSTLVGVNNRNLKTFDVDLATCVRLRKFVPEGKILVAESGIRHRVDIDTLRDADIHAYLIGEAFMREADPGDALKKLIDLET